MSKLMVTIAIVLFMGVLALPILVSADPPMSATVRFGLPNTADDIPPVGHPGSDAHHASDSLVPRTVVISVGGEVTYEIPEGSVHQVAIFEAGMTPDEVDTSPPLISFAGCAGDNERYLPDDVDRLISILADPPCTGGPAEVSFVFDEPGRYLVICSFIPHFVNRDMYGWVIVK